jgi:hypothetical protein
MEAAAGGVGTTDADWPALETRIAMASRATSPRVDDEAPTARIPDPGTARRVIVAHQRWADWLLADYFLLEE